MPIDAHILSVGIQRDQICIWALVDPQLLDTEVREFSAVGTGWQLEDEFMIGRMFLGTVQIDGFVWHVFEKVSPV